MKTQPNNKQDSVPNFLNVVRLFPAPGPCSSQPQGHKTASKFQRIRCTICLTSPDNQKEKRPHLKDVCLPDSYVVTWCNGAAKLLQKTEVSGSSERLHTVRNAIHKGSNRGTAGTAGLSKWLTNRKANGCNVLRWITKLKCVNSEVRTVIIHPGKGFLQWLHGTMSESPWKSH